MALKKDITLKKLKALLEECFSSGVNVKILTPPEKTSFSLEEVGKIALNSYLMGLSEVLDTINGDIGKIGQLRTVQGRAFVIDPEDEVVVFSVPVEDINWEDHPNG
jgi:hypothetical protein